MVRAGGADVRYLIVSYKHISGKYSVSSAVVRSCFNSEVPSEHFDYSISINGLLYGVVDYDKNILSYKDRMVLTSPPKGREPPSEAMRELWGLTCTGMSLYLQIMNLIKPVTGSACCTDLSLFSLDQMHLSVWLYFIFFFFF